jgi:pimeloyl-ACP methyl ester carboxylesterase
LAPPQSDGLTLLLDSSQVNTNWLADGFFAQAFEDASGNVIISFEGSILNLSDNTAYARGSRGADSDILSGRMPQAFLDATAFVQDVDQYLNQHSLGSNPVYLTGHSLGGAEAGYAASVGHESGATFGAPGDLLPNYQPPVSGQTFTNYVDYGDPVGNFGFHFGTVQDIGPAVDAQVSQLLIGTLGPVLGTLVAADLFHTPAHYAADVEKLDPATNTAAAASDSVVTGGGISQLIQQIAAFGTNNDGNFSSLATGPNEFTMHGSLAIAIPHHG